MRALKLISRNALYYFFHFFSRLYDSAWNVPSLKKFIVAIGEKKFAIIHSLSYKRDLNTRNGKILAPCIKHLLRQWELCFVHQAHELFFFLMGQHSVAFCNNLTIITDMAKTKSFTPGKDWVWYSRAVYGEREIAAVVESLNSDWLVPGEYARRFEEAVAGIFGQAFGLFVNSGSSANLLAVDALQLPVGSEVITPACTFSTTVNPLLQCGLIPVVVDIEADTFNIDIDTLEEALTPKTKALMIPHLVGNLNDMKRLRAISDKHGLTLIEDSCDTIGASIQGTPTGIYADVSTTSFYASHIMTAAGGGGMLMCKTKEFADDAKVRRDWGRALPEHFDESSDKRFSFSLQGIAHDGKFVFNRIGYNLKPIDLQAAFGLVQLERLPEFARIRRKNFDALNAFFKIYPEHFALPRELPDSDVRWLAYPITLRQKSPIKRVDLMRYLEEHKIQTRVLFAGNIARHPAYQGAPLKVHGALTNADMVLERSLLIGCHHGLRDEHIRYVTDTVTKFIAEKIY